MSKMATPQEVSILAQIYKQNRNKRLIKMERFYAVLCDEASSLVDFPILIEGDQVRELEERPIQRTFEGINALPDYVIATREALSVANLGEWLSDDGAPVYLDFAQTYQAWLGVPLVVGDEVLGAVVVESKAINAYGPSEERLLSTMAGQVAVALENVRAYKRLQELNIKIAQTQEIVTKTAIARDFVHRINNLAGTIPLWIEMIREELFPSDPRDERLAKYLDLIEKDTTELIDRAVELNRPIQEEKIDIKLLLESILESVKIRHPEITCHQDLESNLGYVEANYFQLSTAIWNPVVNALESMSDGGMLTIKGSMSAGIIGKTWIQIQIEDTGPGIPESEIGRIFELFYTTKGPGKGYGLWRTRSYVEELGGAVNLTSEVGIGTTVVIALPVNTVERNSGE
jgi:signal transduction histidine kinase